MPPKNTVELDKVWIGIPGEDPQQFLSCDLSQTPDITAIVTPDGDYTLVPNPLGGGEVSMRIIINNNDRKMHHIPLRRGQVNKRFKKQRQEFWDEQEKHKTWMNQLMSDRKVLYYIYLPDEEETDETDNR